MRFGEFGGERQGAAETGDRFRFLPLANQRGTQVDVIDRDARIHVGRPPQMLDRNIDAIAFEGHNAEQTEGAIVVWVFGQNLPAERLGLCQLPRLIVR